MIKIEEMDFDVFPQAVGAVILHIDETTDALALEKLLSADDHELIKKSLYIPVQQAAALLALYQGAGGFKRESLEQTWIDVIESANTKGAEALYAIYQAAEKKDDPEAAARAEVAMAIRRIIDTAEMFAEARKTVQKVVRP